MLQHKKGKILAFATRMHLKKTMKERRNLNVLKNVAALARKTRNVKKQIRKVNARKKHNHAKTRIN